MLAGNAGGGERGSGAEVNTESLKRRRTTTITCGDDDNTITFTSSAGDETDETRLGLVAKHAKPADSQQQKQQQPVARESEHAASFSFPASTTQRVQRQQQQQQQQQHQQQGAEHAWKNQQHHQQHQQHLASPPNNQATSASRHDSLSSYHDQLPPQHQQGHLRLDLDLDPHTAHDTLPDFFSEFNADDPDKDLVGLDDLPHFSELKVDSNHADTMRAGLGRMLSSQILIDVVFRAKRTPTMLVDLGMEIPAEGQSGGNANDDEGDWVERGAHVAIVAAQSSEVLRRVVDLQRRRNNPSYDAISINDEVGSGNRKEIANAATNVKTEVGIESREEGKDAKHKVVCDDTKQSPTTSTAKTAPTTITTTTASNTAPKAAYKNAIVVEFDSGEVDGAILDDLLKYMYAGTVDLGHNHNELSLLQAASHLRIDALVAMCRDYLSTAGNLTRFNMLSVLQVAVQCHDRVLLEQLSRSMSAELSVLVTMPGWFALNATSLVATLVRDGLQVNSEVEVFDALVAWAERDIKSRRTHLDTILLHPGVLRVTNMLRDDLIKVSTHELVATSDSLRTAMYNEAVRRVNQGTKTDTNSSNTDTVVWARRDKNRGNQRGGAPGTKTLRHTLVGHSKSICSITQYDRFVLTGASDGQICVWDTESWLCVETLVGHTNQVLVLKMCGDQLVSGGPDKSLRVWNPATWTCERSLQGLASSVCALAVCGTKVCTGTENGQIIVWDARTWTCEYILKAHSHVIWSLVEAGGQLVSGSSDTTIKVWDTRTWKLIVVLQKHLDEVQALVIAGHLLVSGSDDGCIKVWDRRTWVCVNTLIDNNEAVLSLAVSGSSLYSGMGDGCVRVWDITTLQSRGTLFGHESCVMALLVRHRLLFSASYDRTIKVWADVE